MGSKAPDNRIIVEDVEHSKRGASGAHRWLECPGSINLTDKLEAQGKRVHRTNPAAAEGTAAHLVLSSCLEDGSDAHEMRGMMIEVGDWSFEVDDEMVEGVQMTLDFVRERCVRAELEGFEVELHVERSLSSIFDEDAFGTPDVVIHILGDRLIVIDFKYGRGVTVEPTSIQNKYYGYLAVENYLESPDAVKVVESWIAQPRIPHPGGLMRRHVTDPDELTAWWTEVILPGIQDTRNKDAHLTIGEHCRFCPNKAWCPALKRETFDFAVDVDPEYMTSEELGQALEKGKIIQKFMETLEAEAFKRLRAGEPVAGQKLVQKKGNRAWKSSMAVPDEEGQKREVQFEDAVVDAFGLDAYTEPAIKTPAQLEKLNAEAKDFTIRWAYKPDTGLTMAPVSDKRPEVRPAIERFRQAG